MTILDLDYHFETNNTTNMSRIMWLIPYESYKSLRNDKLKSDKVSQVWSITKMDLEKKAQRYQI